MSRNIFLKKIKEYSSINVFNPYLDVCSTHDLDNAPKVRLNNLQKILNSALVGTIDSFWLGRDLGYRGGRRTGVALTDEIHLELASQSWQVNLAKATTSNPMLEKTASTIWKFRTQIPEKIFMWNLFPFHPYEKGKAFSNRPHTSEERAAGIEILNILYNLLMPQKIIAIGNEAAESAYSYFSNFN